MYTSGWPKIQNRCWYSSGSPPAAGSKNSVPKLRSKNTMISATVTIGIANRVRNAITSIIHTNTGIRMSVMPGQRMLMHRDDEVDRRGGGADAEQDQADGPEVGPTSGEEPGVERGAGERGVAEPPAVGRAAEEEARVDEDAAEEHHPEAEHVDPREGDVARADHAAAGSSCRVPTAIGMPTRNTIVVPCIVNIWLYCPAVSTVPFGWKSWRRISSASTPPSTRKTSAVHDVQDADLLVVDRREPAPDARGRPSVGAGCRPARSATTAVASSTVVIGLLPWSVTAVTSVSRAGAGSRRSSSASARVIVGSPGGVSFTNDGIPTQVTPGPAGSRHCSASIGIIDGASRIQSMSSLRCQLVVAAGERVRGWRGG